MTAAPKVSAFPFDFPLASPFGPATTALAVIDVQHDFCGPGGMMDRSGADLDHLRGSLPAIARLLAAARAAGFPVVHTRETFRPDLSDAQPHRLWRAQGEGVAVGDPGPLGRALVAGEPGWQIVPEAAPITGEAVFDKASYGPFATTAIGGHLKDLGTLNLVVCGLTTDCCIHTTVREALDRGYETLVVEDACAAANPSVHAHALALFKRPSGVFGASAPAATVVEAMASPTGFEPVLPP